ncbi:hypothetical protein Dimus_002763 [Dionaea muscipula]
MPLFTSSFITTTQDGEQLMSAYVKIRSCIYSTTHRMLHHQLHISLLPHCSTMKNFNNEVAEKSSCYLATPRLLGSCCSSPRSCSIQEQKRLQRQPLFAAATCQKLLTYAVHT